MGRDEKTILLFQSVVETPNGFRGVPVIGTASGYSAIKHICHEASEFVNGVNCSLLFSLDGFELTACPGMKEDALYSIYKSKRTERERREGEERTKFRFMKKRADQETLATHLTILPQTRTEVLPWFCKLETLVRDYTTYNVQTVTTYFYRTFRYTQDDYYNYGRKKKNESVFQWKKRLGADGYFRFVVGFALLEIGRTGTPSKSIHRLVRQYDKMTGKAVVEKVTVKNKVVAEVVGAMA